MVELSSGIPLFVDQPHDTKLAICKGLRLEVIILD
jgi:hypothetical protein